MERSSPNAKKPFPMWVAMASRTLGAGALPHALLDSCQRPTQIRGSEVAGESMKRLSPSMAQDGAGTVGDERHPSLLSSGFIL